jgi:NADH-quinone oxidoreductase subunit C
VELFKKKIESAFSGVRVSIPERYRMTIIAGKDEVISILNFLKGEGYNHLGIISCVDWPGEGELELVYILSAYMRDNDTYDDDCKANIILKTRISREKPEFATAINVFENAEPYEREIHEFFGVDFKGHPRLTPLLLEREYEIPPFRKDFDTRKYVEEFFDKIPFVENEDGQK